MAGNSQRRGATRNPGSKKAATAGTGGKNRRSLEGRGPTPKAEDRPKHKAYKAKTAAERRAELEEHKVRTGTASRSATSGYGSGTRGGAKPRNKATVSADREIVSGRNSVVEALRAEIPASAVYVAVRVEADDRIREILKVASARSIPLLEITKPELDRLTDNSIHQGVAIAVPRYEYADPDDLLERAEWAGQAPLLVALDGVTDPRNLGAVLRSAGAFGVHGVVVPERRAAGVTASAWKVSAGAAARVPVARATNLTRTLTAYKKAGLFIVGLDAGGEEVVGEMSMANDPIVLVIGSEGKGLSRLVREACDAIVSIPIAQTTESLNAGVAAGIALYEVAQARARRAV